MKAVLAGLRRNVIWLLAGTVTACAGASPAANSARTPVVLPYTAASTPRVRVATIATGLAGIGALALDPRTSTLYALEPAAGRVIALAPDGARTTLTSALRGATWLAFDPRRGRLLAIDAARRAVVSVAPNGRLRSYVTWPPNRGALTQIAVSSGGTLYATQQHPGSVVVATAARRLRVYPVVKGMLALAQGRGAMYVTNADFGLLAPFNERRVAPGVRSPLLRFAAAMAYDPRARSFFFTDPQHDRILEARAGSVRVVAGDGRPGAIDGAAAVAEFDAPLGIAYDAAHNALFVADAGDGAIREITGL